MIYLDLFAGIGGFHLGFEQAGLKFDKVYYSEVDKYAQQIYKRQFPRTTAVGDVSKIRGSELGKVDIVTFGSPCQDFSTAGKRAGLGGARSSLIGEALRLVSELRPGIFIWENVKGAYSSNNGRDFQAILRTIADIGLYECEWQLLNTAWFLPQNRERIYLIGHLRGRSGRKVFPIGESETKLATTISTHEGSRKESNYVLKKIGTIGNDSQGYRVYDTSGISCQLTAQGGAGLYEITSTQPRCGNPKKGGTGPLRSTEKCFTINSRPHIVNRIRRLTPTECERLQGFPDNWTAKGITKNNKEVDISDTQRYKCLGNAVSVPVVKEIAKRIKQSLEAKNE